MKSVLQSCIEDEGRPLGIGFQLMTQGRKLRDGVLVNAALIQSLDTVNSHSTLSKLCFPKVPVPSDD
jgi:hypothetical protein